jgi:hypothetical protein
MIIAAVPGVRGIDDACTGAWYANLRRRHYHTMLGIEQMEPGIGRRAALPKISLACNTEAITGQDKPINT